VIAHPADDLPHEIDAGGRDADPPGDGFGRIPDLSEWHPREEDYPPDLWRAYSRWTVSRTSPTDPPPSVEDSGPTVSIISDSELVPS
jgi:hypothetical protein